MKTHKAKGLEPFWPKAYKFIRGEGQVAGSGLFTVFCVGAGGFIGAICRYGLGLLPLQGTFPITTFFINFAGAVIIGIIAEYAYSTSLLSQNSLLFLKTGVCGGFTTFSTFSLETVALFEKGHWQMGTAYAISSVLACMAGVMIGKFIAKTVF